MRSRGCSASPWMRSTPPAGRCCANRRRIGRRSRLHRRRARVAGLRGGAAAAGLSGDGLRAPPAAGRAEYLRRRRVQAAGASEPREIELIRGLGVEFRYETEIRTQQDLEQLEREFDRLFLGVGPGRCASTGHSGRRSPRCDRRARVHRALQNGRSAADRRERRGDRRGQHRHRRGQRGAAAGRGECGDPLSPRRKAHVRLRLRVRACEAGGRAVSCGASAGQDSQRRTRHLAPSNACRPRLARTACSERSGSNFHFDCQQIISAIGQSPLLELLSAGRGVELSNGRIVIDRATGATSNPKYFAGGDCVNGGREVVDAVADGKRAGIAIAQAFEVARNRFRAWRRLMPKVPELAVNFAGHSLAESLLAGLGAAHQLRRADHARLRRRLGRRGVEDHRRADHQRQLALLVRSTGTASA